MKNSGYQEMVLKALAGNVNDFYLGGGTALALFYFRHRESMDLDFFTRHYLSGRVREIIDGLSKGLKAELTLEGEELRPGRIKISVYQARFAKGISVKIDFVEDWLEPLRSLKVVDGINILSLEDIYIRKIWAVTGMIEKEDSVGRKVLVGGRQEAKDFIDLYCLSNTFMPLAKFAAKYCDPTRREALIRWFRSFDRMIIKGDLTDLRLEKEFDYNLVEKHFKKEIDMLIEEEIDFL